MGGRMGIKRVAATGWHYHEKLYVTDRCHPMLDERKKWWRSLLLLPSDPIYNPGLGIIFTRFVIFLSPYRTGHAVA
jgi:hypothetical protein